MKTLTPEQYEQIKDALPVQRGNVTIENLVFLNAVFYVAENGCKWRKLPSCFGKWNTIYVRMNRWAKNGVWPKVLEALQTQLNISLDVTALSLDSTSIKVHPDGTGAEKNGPQSIGKSRGGRNTKIHLIVANERTPIVFQLSPGQAADDPEGRVLIQQLPEYYKTNNLSLLTDKAYEGDEIRGLAVSLGLEPVVPPKSNRREPWSYDKELYKDRNIVERNFRNIKQFRRAFTRYDKLDTMYSSFVVFAMICETLRE